MAQGIFLLSNSAPISAQAPVLVVEDDLDIRETCRQILELEGYDVLTAANGQQAFEILRSCQVRPALILLDMMMPVMNGWEFLKSRCADPGASTIPVVVVTAAGQMGNFEASTVQGFLKKPIELDTLLDTVKKFCH